MSTYVFDQTWQGEHDRLRALEALFDASTMRHLANLGVGRDWRCLEVGAGAGSVARRLADVVGPGGHVLATDLDARHLEGRRPGNLEVRRHDVAADPLPEGAFDLVHARAVLIHLPERERVLERMVAATRPGGWVVVEDGDFGDPMLPALMRYVDPPEHTELLQRILQGFRAVLAGAGADAGFGARLPRALREAGLRQVGAQLHAPPLGSDAQRDFFDLTIRHLRGLMVATGLVNDQEVDRFLELNAGGGLRYVMCAAVTAWGRRPEPDRR